MKVKLIKTTRAKIIRGVFAAGGILLMSLAATSWAADPAAGRKKAETCLGCHGIPEYVNVYPTFHVPKIGGQHADYLAAALKAYRSKERSHPTMQANASLLTDEDIADLAAYFATLK